MLHRVPDCIYEPLCLLQLKKVAIVYCGVPYRTASARGGGHTRTRRDKSSDRTRKRQAVSESRRATLKTKTFDFARRLRKTIRREDGLTNTPTSRLNVPLA